MKTIAITINVPAEVLEDATLEQHKAIYTKCMLRMLQLKANVDEVPPEVGMLMSLGGLVYREVMKQAEERDKAQNGTGVDNPITTAE